MVETSVKTSDPVTFARTLTYLGIDRRFLENGELQTLPRDQRGAVVDAIVSQKLEEGDWPVVINMIFGGIGKADVLYGGDLGELREKIIVSARGSARGLDSRIIELLGDKKERELLLDLALSSNIGYQSLLGIERIVKPLLETDLDRKKTFAKMIGDMALEEGKYLHALREFVQIGDSINIAHVFERSLEHLATTSYSYESRAQEAAIEAAIYDSGLKNERLKRLIFLRKKDDSHGRKFRIDIKTAFKLFQEHGVVLTEEERTTLYERAAEEFSSYQLLKPEERYTPHLGSPKKEFIDPELALSWAKRHVESSPGKAYDILSTLSYEGREILNAATNGLEARIDKPVPEDDSRSFVIDHVKTEHLRAIYPGASFTLREKIATRLRGDKDFGDLAFRKLSHEAEINGDLDSAYRCWFEQEKPKEDEYIDGVRSRLIQRDIDEANKEGKDDPKLFFLCRQDVIGYRQVIDTLVGAAPNVKNQFGFIEEAYRLARINGTPEQLEGIRRRLVEIGPITAMKKFMGTSYLYGREKGQDMKDPTGFNYALGVLAERQGIPIETLKPLVEKYARSLK